MNTLLKIAALYNLAFAIFHMFFWKIFTWKSQLRKMNAVNQAIMQVLNLCLTFCFILFATISFFHTTELLTTQLGHTILLGISLFWWLRAIEQILFFKLTHWVSILLFILFIVGASMYLIPMLFTLGCR